MRHVPKAAFSLLEVLIAGVIGSLVIGGVLYVVQTTFKFAAKSEQRAELASFTALLTDQVSCADTFDAATNPDVAANPGFFAACAAGALPTKLYGKRASPTAPAPLVVSNDPANPTRVGPWTIRAVCSGDRILVDAAQPKPGIANALTETNPAQFQTDPQQRQRALDWASITDTSPRRVVKTVSALCRNLFIAPAPAPTANPACPGCYVDTPCPDGTCVLVSGVLHAAADSPIACGSNWGTVHWGGVATCPAGTELISGGVNCQVPAWPGMGAGGNMLTASPAPVAPFTTFVVDCCGARPHTRGDAPPNYTQATSGGFAEQWGLPGQGPIFALCKKLQ